MLDALKTAGYFSNKYQLTFGKEIDEMKLHKLLYFFLRECFVENEKSGIEISFEARQYGPVSLEIRETYKDHKAYPLPLPEDLKCYQTIMDRVFNNYAAKSSWSLSSITHGEESWMNARERYHHGQEASLRLEDIKKDASRIRIRRYILNESTT